MSITFRKWLKKLSTRGMMQETGAWQTVAIWPLFTMQMNTHSLQDGYLNSFPAFCFLNRIIEEKNFSKCDRNFIDDDDMNNIKY